MGDVKFDNPRKHGFRQVKPREAGVYFVAIDHATRWPPKRVAEGWDVAYVSWQPSGWRPWDETRELSEAGHWMIETLNGVSYGWRAGMWLKGPISPHETERAARAQEKRS